MALHLLGINFLPHDANWLNTVATIAGILISLASFYGVVIIFPNFIKQKRIEHLSDNARSALNILIEAEEALKKLFFAVRIDLDRTKLEPLQTEVSLVLNRLRNILLLIVKNAEIPENFIKEEHLQELEQLIYALSNKTQHFPLRLSDILETVDKDWAKHKRLNLAQLERLRDILIKIHGMNDKSQ